MQKTGNHLFLKQQELFHFDSVFFFFFFCIHEVACSQTLYFLFKVHWACVIKYKPREIYWLPVQGGRGGGRRKLKRPKRKIKQHLFTGYSWSNITGLYYRYTQNDVACTARKVWLCPSGLQSTITTLRQQLYFSIPTWVYAITYIIYLTTLQYKKKHYTYLARTMFFHC